MVSWEEMRGGKRDVVKEGKTKDCGILATTIWSSRRMKKTIQEKDTKMKDER
jgi:hypothetical protein